jgi:hypothetical protein
LFDPYTFTHVIHGFLFIAGVHLLWPRLPEIWKFVGALSAEMVWEAIENTTWIIERYRSDTISLGYAGDAILNSFGDVLVAAVGIVVAWRLGAVKTIVLALLIEAALLLTIRDNLLLNIIMLLYPMESVRIWQSGQ